MIRSRSKRKSGIKRRNKKHDRRARLSRHAGLQKLEDRYLLACDVTGEFSRAPFKHDVTLDVTNGAVDAGTCTIDQQDANRIQLSGSVLGPLGFPASALHNLELRFRVEDNLVATLVQDDVTTRTITVLDQSTDPPMEKIRGVADYSLTLTIAPNRVSEIDVLAFQENRNDGQPYLVIDDFEVRNDAPAPASPDLVDASDTGSDITDDETFDVTPTFELSGLQPSDTVDLFRSGTNVSVATGTVAAGRSSIQLTDTSLSVSSADEDKFSYRAQITSGNAVFSTGETEVTFDIRQQRPNTPDLQSASDRLQPGVGFVVDNNDPALTDDLTADETPTFDISGIDSTSVQLFRSELVVTGAGALIPDIDAVSSEIVIESSDLEHGDSVSDLLVTIEGLEHTYSSDLKITLSNIESGIEVDLFNLGADATEFGGTYTFGDSLSGNIREKALSLDDDLSIPGGDYFPATTLGAPSSLGAFAGQDIAGTWVLTIDDMAIADVGSFAGWSLTFNSQEASKTTNASASSVSLSDRVEVEGEKTFYYYARQTDTVGNSATSDALNVTIDATVGRPTIGAPGTPVNTTIFDLKNALDELGLPSEGFPPSTQTQPWQISFDKSTQTIWVTAESGMIQDGPAFVAQFDPATGRLDTYDLKSALDALASNSHGTFFDFNSHLTPRVWVAHRAFRQDSTRLSYIDLDPTTVSPGATELVSYNLSNVAVDGAKLRDLHAVFVDALGTVWATSLLGDRILEIIVGPDPETGSVDLASREARVIVHDVPAELLSGVEDDEELNAHALEVAVNDETGEAFVWMVAGSGAGRTALLRPTKTRLLEDAEPGDTVIRVFGQIDVDTRISINAGGTTEQIVKVTQVTPDAGSFLLTLENPLTSSHVVNEEIRGPNRWLTWDFGDVDPSLEEARGTFTKIDDNETPGDPTDDRIVVTMPVAIAGGQPDLETKGIVHVIDPSNTLASENATAPAQLETYIIPRIDDATAEQQLAAPNQPFVDRSGEAFFIDRIGSIGRFLPGDLSPTLAGSIRAIPFVETVDDVSKPVQLPEPDKIVADGNIFARKWLQVESSRRHGDESPVDGLDQYQLDGRDVSEQGTAISGRGEGAFRGFLNASNVLYSSLSISDKLGVTVFAESARRQMSAVPGPAPEPDSGALVQARMAFQVISDGSLILTARGNGKIADDQINLLAEMIDADPARANYRQHQIFGEANAVKTEDGRVHVLGRSPQGGVVHYTYDPPKGTPDEPTNGWEHQEIFNPHNWTVTRRTGGLEMVVLAEDPVPAGDLGFSVTTANGHLLVIPIEGGNARDLTAEWELERDTNDNVEDDDVTGQVFSAASTIKIENSTFVYGTNQTGDLVRYKIGAATSTVKVIPVPNGDRNLRMLQNVRTLSANDRYHVFATDGTSRLVRWELDANGDVKLDDDGKKIAENISQLTAGPAATPMDRTNFGYFPFQEDFAGRVYTYISPIDAGDGTIRVYGTNGGDLVEFVFEDGEWRAGNLTQDTNATHGQPGTPRVPGNAVFGGPAVYTDSAGGRHILQINAEGEVIEYYTFGSNNPVAPNQIQTQNVNFFTGKRIEDLLFDSELLVGHWKFEEMEISDPVVDSSGKGNDGTHENMEVPDGPVMNAAVGDKSLQFDGVDDFVSIPPDASLDLSGGVFTQSVWIYPELAENGYHGVLGYHGNGINERYPSIWVQDKTRIHAGFGDGVFWNGFSTGEVLKEDAWNHVVTTFDGTTYKVYVDGIEVFATDKLKDKTPAPTNRFDIGRVDNHFKGKIDEVQIFKRALDDTQINNLFNGRSPNWSTIELTIAADSVGEGDGAAATTATVTRDGSTSQSLEVTLNNSDDSEISIPASVTIPAGQSSVTFDVAAVDDSVVDGTQTVTITASTEHDTDQDTLDVDDDDTLPVPVGLVGHWMLEETAIGQTVIDSSGLGNDGQHASITSPNGPSSDAIIGAYSLSTDGVDDHVAIPSDPSLDLSGGRFTQSIWIYPRHTDTGYHGVLGYQGNGLTERYPGIWVQSSDRIHAGFGDGTNWNSVSTGSVLTPFAWNHVVTTFDGTNFKVYVDGVEVLDSTRFAGLTPAATQQLDIGRIDNHFDGMIDDVRIYNRALDSSEVGQLFNDSVTPPTLSVAIDASSIVESDGPSATSATVTRGGDTTVALTVSLLSNDESEAVVPASVTIPTGQTSVTFDIEAIDDALVDGTQTVTISASAGGYVAGSDEVDVTDDDTATPVGLVGHWMLEESAIGETVVDSSGNGNDGVHTNITQPDGPSSDAIVGNFSLSTDGVDDHVSIPADPSLDLSGGLFTQSVWILPEITDNGYHGILGFQGSELAERYPSLWVTGQDRIHAGFGDGTEWNSIFTGRVLTPFAWNHVVTTFDGNEFKVYVDGVEEFSTLALAGKTPAPTQQLDIGRVDNHFDGLIDDVRIYNRALDATEVNNLFSQNAPASPVNQNQNLAQDVNDNGEVSSMDALLIINLMGEQGEGEATDVTKQYYPDVNGDDSVSALDALNVINFIARQSQPDALPVAVAGAEAADEEDGEDPDDQPIDPTTPLTGTGIELPTPSTASGTALPERSTGTGVGLPTRTTALGTPIPDPFDEDDEHDALENTLDLLAEDVFGIWI